MFSPPVGFFLPSSCLFSFTMRYFAPSLRTLSQLFRSFILPVMSFPLFFPRRQVKMSARSGIRQVISLSRRHIVYLDSAIEYFFDTVRCYAASDAAAMIMRRHF